MAWAVQLFEAGGYYATVIEATPATARAVVDARTMRAPSLVACSLPYAVLCEPGRAPDVSLPDGWRAELATLEPGKADP